MDGLLVDPESAFGVDPADGGATGSADGAGLVFETSDVFEVFGASASVSAGLDVGSLGEAALVELLVSARMLQGAIESLITRVGVRADELAADGRSGTAREILLGEGAVRGHVARAEASRAELAGRSPAVAAALRAGSLDANRLDSLARHTRRLTDDQLTSVPIERLVERAQELPADTFDRVVKQAVEAQLANESPTTAEEQRAASEFRHWFDHRTGMGRFSGQLDPERYEAFTTAVDQHTAALANSPAGGGGPATTKNPNLAAAALVELATTGTTHNRLPHISVVVDEHTLRVGGHAATIAQTANGHDLSSQTVARLCCDAVLQRVVVDDRGLPIDVGRKHRTATPAQWTALRSIYSTCGWTGCQRPLSFCQAHHIREWEHGGPTDMANLIPLCNEHHHRVHEGRWHIELLPDRTPVIAKPDGAIHSIGSPPTRRPAPPVGVP
jgi:hypothetical protein